MKLKIKQTSVKFYRNEDVQLPSPYVDSDYSSLETKYFKFLKEYKFSVSLNCAEDFHAWWEQLELALKYLGLEGTATKLIEGKIKNKSTKYPTEVEDIMKNVIRTSLGNDNLTKSDGITVQNFLYNIAYNLGLIITEPELIKMENEFSIDIRKPVEDNLTKWNTLIML